VLSRLTRLAKWLLAVAWVRGLYERLTRWSLELGALNRVTATVYSLLGALTFNREQYAVLRGRRDYYRNLHRARTTHVELRRNVHRLEKGMSMRPRRPVFAKDYIGETVDFYLRALELAERTTDSGIDTDELVWAHNVLAHYFEIVDASDPVVARELARFKQASYEPETSGARPFARKDSTFSDIGYDQLLALAQQRRSVRWFLDKPVPREAIDKALLVARQSPTACNRLPYEFLVFDDPEQVRTVASLPNGTKGYRHQIPVIVVIKGDLEAYFSPRDRHAIYVDASLAAMAFMYALEVQGLASSAINWPDFEPLEAKMARTLKLKPSERVVMLVAVGYADPEGIIPFSQKKSLEVLRSYNTLGQ
jgi:nitroreductase